MDSSLHLKYHSRGYPSSAFPELSGNKTGHRIKKVQISSSRCFGKRKNQII